MNATITQLAEVLNRRPDPVTEAEWLRWTLTRPELCPFTDMDDFVRTVDQADTTEQNRLIRVLARLAAVDGDNDPRAAEWLAWMLRPGVVRIGRDVWSLAESHELNQIIAGALWIEIRTARWDRPNCGAGSILRQIRSRVLAELEMSRRNRTFPPSVLPFGSPEWIEGRGARPLAESSNTDAEDAEEMVASLLDWATKCGVISERDRRIMCAVLAAIEDMPKAQARSRNAGLCSMEVSIAAGAAVQVSGTTVRRVTRKTIDKLTKFAPVYLASAA